MYSARLTKGSADPRGNHPALGTTSVNRAAIVYENATYSD